ncbi:MAG: hypothetical protein ACOH2F_00370 [Cellulomonas sp.]
MTAEPGTRAVSALLRLYPAAWRERYGDEVADLLAGSPVSLRSGLDLARGAIDAHVNLSDVLGRWSMMETRLRSTAVTTFTAWVVFCVAVGGLNKVSEEPAFTQAARGHAGVGVSYAIVQGSFILAMVAVLVGGLPLAYVALREGWRRRDAVIGWLALVPLLAAGVVLASIVVANGVSDATSSGVHSAVTISLFVGLVAVGGAATIATVVAVRVGARRATLPAGLLRLAGWAAAVAAGAITIGVAALVGYGWALRTDAPTLFQSANGLLATPLPASLLAIVLTGIIATALADHAAVDGLHLLRRGPDHPER